jgi:hypothetical protein
VEPDGAGWSRVTLVEPETYAAQIYFGMGSGSEGLISYPNIQDMHDI